jgi:hypothetical protein
MSAHALLRLSFAGDAETDTRVDVTSRTGGYASGVIISFDICMLADGESRLPYQRVRCTVHPQRKRAYQHP